MTLANEVPGDAGVIKRDRQEIHLRMFRRTGIERRQLLDTAHAIGKEKSTSVGFPMICAEEAPRLSSVDKWKSGSFPPTLTASPSLAAAEFRLSVVNFFTESKAGVNLLPFLTPFANVAASIGLPSASRYALVN